MQDRAQSTGQLVEHKDAAGYRRRRRLEVLGAAVVSASLMHLALLAGASGYILREHTWPEIVAGSSLLIIIAGVATAKLDRSKMRRPKAYVWLYPPWWCAVPLAGLAFTLLAIPLACMVPWSIFYGLGPEVFCYLGPSLVILPSVGAFALWKVTTNHRPSDLSYAVPAKEAVGAAAPATSKTGIFFGDWRSLLDWVESDDKVKSRDDDAFEHVAIADQLTERLAHSMREGFDDTAIALIGKMGSGKSSIMELVKESFQQQPSPGARVEFVQVSLWPFSEPTAAVDGILSDLVHAIERVADALPLHGLPKNYVAVIATRGGLFSALSNLMAGDGSPRTTVEQIGKIATALGVQFVLVIEDIERFGESPKETGKGMDRIRPIVSLLYLLKQQPSVSVVIPTDYMLGPSDPAKLASAVEYVPSLELAMVWRAVWTLRDHCLSGAVVEKEWIDPASPKARGDLAVPKPDDDSSWRLLSERRSSFMFPQAAICHLLSTPRNLKWALRDCNQAWRSLIGEIDFDVLLCLCVLRVFDHGIIALIRDRQDQLRTGYTGPANVGDGEEGPDEVLPELDDGTLRKFDPLEIRAIRTLLKFLFKSGGEDGGVISHPQGIFGPFGEYYWQRFMTRTIDPKMDSDQRLLSLLEEWKSSIQSKPSPELDKLVADGALIRFGARFNDREKIRLLDHFFTSRVGESADIDQKNHHPNWLGSLTALFRVGRVPGKDLKGTVERLIRDAITRNLPLCLDLEYRFTRWGQESEPLLSQELATELRRDIRHLLVNEFKGNAAQLGKAVNSGNAIVLVDAAFGPARGSDADLSVPPWDGWPDFATELVSLAQVSPEVGIPQLLSFMTVSSMPLGQAEQATSQIDEKALASLFDKPKVLRVLLDVKHHFQDDDIRRRLNCATTYALEFFRTEDVEP